MSGNEFNKLICKMWEDDTLPYTLQCMSYEFSEDIVDVLNFAFGVASLERKFGCTSFFTSPNDRKYVIVVGGDWSFIKREIKES